MSAEETTLGCLNTPTGREGGGGRGRGGGRGGREERADDSYMLWCLVAPNSTLLYIVQSITNSGIYIGPHL